MIHLLCSIYDVKAGSHFPPYSSANRELAIRTFAASCSDPQSMLSKFPADFVLYLVGSFDDSNGFLVKVDAPEVLCSGSNFREKL